MKVKPKHAKSKGWPEKFEAGKENWDGSIITKREEAIGNYHLDLINNLEFNPTDYVELDGNKIEMVILQFMRHTKKDDKFQLGRFWKELAQAIVDSKDIVKAKGEVLK